MSYEIMKKNLLVQPMTALTVTADQSIAECIQLMRKKDIGSVLVISDDGKDHLIGIFTERDLLKKVELIEQGKHWKKPIRTVMTHPITTLELQYLEKAEEILFNNHFRHLPIVTYDESGGCKIAGIVSMRDFFKKNFLIPAEKLPLREIHTRPLPHASYLESQDKELYRILAHLNHENAWTWEQSPKSIETTPYSLLAIDLDGLKVSEWTKSLQEKTERTQAQQVLIFWNPVLHSPKTQELLHQISQAKNYFIFSKPVHILALSECLNLLLQRTRDP